MKISNKYSPNFQAGLTKQIQSEIKRCDIKKISKAFTRAGIETDFKNNKTIAWCSLKCLKIFKNLGLPLPKGVFVEDFNKLNIGDLNVSAFNNVLPTFLYKDNNEITEGQTIFFNEFVQENFSGGNRYWDNIDKISDEDYDLDESSTSHFLYTFLHEFAHSAHEGNLINLIGAKKMSDFFLKSYNPEYCFQYQTKFKKLLSNICHCATISPVESVACDLPEKIVKKMNNSLDIEPNFVLDTPYKNYSFFRRFFGIELNDTKESLLKNIWNGFLP